MGKRVSTPLSPSQASPDSNSCRAVDFEGNAGAVGAEEAAEEAGEEGNELHTTIESATTRSQRRISDSRNTTMMFWVCRRRRGRRSGMRIRGSCRIASGLLDLKGMCAF